MALRGNRGEWAEIYTFFKLLSDGKIHAADENMCKLEDIYFPILKIIREEVLGQIYDYKTGDKIRIFLNDEFLSEVEVSAFTRQADYLFDKITTAAGHAFAIPTTEDFMRSIYVQRIKEPGTHKADILIQIQEIHTGMVLKSGFSIKSDFSSKAHLINASEATNFIFEIENFDDNKMNITNAICTGNKIIDRISFINNHSGGLKYVSTLRPTTKSNLVVVDSLMPQLLGQGLKIHYTQNINSCSDVCIILEETDPLGYDHAGTYKYKFKKLLSACALGLKLGQSWDGIEEANGGYIVVKNDGEVLAYHIYNRDIFENFLLQNTKFERGSTSKHNYCYVYKENDKYYIRLNLAIRFK